MGRKISEIKSEIARELMRNESAAALYGFEPGTEFGAVFGAASVESILLYVWAVCAWAVEELVGRHREEVTEALGRQVAHRPQWYREKVMAFMAGRALKGDSDEYDMEGLSASEVEAARVVKHAVATESGDASLLTIKVAGETGGERGPLSVEHERELRAYISEVKDAGVRIALVNMEADTFDCKVDVYYDALLEPAAVRGACESAIVEYIENLPFNGEYTNMALTGRLQGVEGVRIVELRESWSRAANAGVRTRINARRRPAAGYFRAGSIDVEMIAYDEQED